ncbi:MAG: PDZ domain-containing protein [Bacteroidetes bacterium]|nr:PDZ domain-containing protein [Bacteroidota bacterium]
MKGKLSKLDNFKILNDTSNYIRQPDFTWIKNDTMFSKENQNLLFQIIIDYKPVTNKYLKGSEVISHRENPFSDIDSVSEPYRLLGLFRYWNIVNYFYPYKNLADKNWDSVLVENIPRFEKANSYYGYFYQIQHLTTEINDSHAWGTQIDSKKGLKQEPTVHAPYPTYYYPPFKIEMHDTNLFISKILNDSLAQSGTIQIGDMLLKVNDKDVSKAISYFRNNTPSSTEQSFRNAAKYSLIRYLADTSLFSFIVVREKDTLKVTNIKGVDYTLTKNC